jgi:hypothetical protein
MTFSHLVPSASLICTLVVGSVWSTSNIVPLIVLSTGAIVPLPLPLGKAPGIDSLPASIVPLTAGTGAPSLMPVPENAEKDVEGLDGV